MSLEKDGFSRSKENGEKTRRWRETSEKIDNVVDKQGKPIDENIKEGIIALNVLGIHTTASCEGHLGHGTYAPYIDIESEDILELEDKLGKSVDKEATQLVMKEIIRKNLEERKKVTCYLEKFYENRQVLFNTRLVIQGLARERSRLESQGTGLQKIEVDDVRKIQLQLFQEEMKQFIEFLKKEYFG